MNKTMLLREWKHVMTVTRLHVCQHANKEVIGRRFWSVSGTCLKHVLNGISVEREESVATEREI